MAKILKIAKKTVKDTRYVLRLTKLWSKQITKLDREIAK